jgi:hypothetical protein
MSLIKPKTLTPRQLAANRRNARRSHGAVTPQGRRRAAIANLRHGFYSRDWAAFLPALGENPAEFNRLLDSLIDTWKPANAFEMALVERLARTLWRMNRGDHIQEALALEQLEESRQNLEANTEAAFQFVAEKLPALKALAASAARKDFATQAEDLKLCVDMGGEEPGPADHRILVLLQRLRSPGRVDPEMQPLCVNLIADVPAAEGEERGQLLAELRETLAELIQLCGRAEAATGTSELPPPERVYAMMAPEGPGAALMLRMEDSGMRQLWRITNLLLMARKAGVGFEQDASVGSEQE